MSAESGGVKWRLEAERMWLKIRDFRYRKNFFIDRKEGFKYLIDKR